MRWKAAVISCVLLGACHHYQGPIVYAPRAEPAAAQWCAGTCDDHVDIRYLGVAGFVISHGGAALVTGPSFTNPGFFAVAPAIFSVTSWAQPKSKANADLIRKYFPGDADSAEAIIVGHGHYDHLMDVPFIATQLAPRAWIYGSPTTFNMIGQQPGLNGRVQGIDTLDAGTVFAAGKWWYSRPDSAFRMMALRSAHDPNVKLGPLTATIGNGVVTAPARKLPERAGDWEMGEVYAWLIDVLEPHTGNVLFRIYFQDAPTTPPLGFPPASELWQHPIDVALLCIPTWTNAPHALDTLVRWLRPGAVIASHWEWFFGPMSQPPLVNPISEVKKFRRVMERELPPSSPWAIPLPQEVIRIGIPRR